MPPLRRALEAARELLTGPQADPAAGRRHAEAAVAIAREHARPADEAEALALLGQHALRLGDVSQAIEACTRALHLFDRHGTPQRLVDVRLTLVMACNRAGLIGQALRESTTAVGAAERLGDPRRLAWALNRAGVTHDNVGDLDTAIDLLQEALQLSRDLSAAPDETGDELLFASLNNLAAAHARRAESLRTAGHAGDSMHDARRALELAREALASARPHPMREAVVLGVISEASLMLGELDGAFVAVTQSRDLATRIGMPELALLADLDEANIRLQQGDPVGALRLLEAAHARGLPEGHHVAWCRYLTTRHQALKSAGRADEALGDLEALLVIERQLGRQRQDEQLRLLRRDGELLQSRRQARQHRRRADELEQRAAEAQRQARLDDLTQLANRRHFDEELARRLSVANADETCWLALVDIDEFKAINDQLGHAAGDAVLRAIASLLQARTRAVDVVARIGGDEFALLLPETPSTRPRDVCERLRQAVADVDWSRVVQAHRLEASRDETAPQVTVSVGLATARPGEQPAAVLRRADAALYVAKRSGRNAIAQA